MNSQKLFNALSILDVLPNDEELRPISQKQQLQSLSGQITQAVSRKEYKYLAHQLSVLYQLIAAIGLRELQAEVEKNFDWLRECVDRGAGEDAAHWLLWILRKLKDQTEKKK